MLRLIQKFYRYINSQKKVRNGNGKKRNGSGLAESDFEKAGEFNGQFTDDCAHQNRT